MDSVRILVVDDHEALRRGVRLLLSSRSDLFVCGEAGDGLEAIERTRSLQPDIILMDISMPRMDGLEASRIIRQEMPESQVIIISQNDPAIVSRQAADAHVSGYVPKTYLSRDLLPTIERVISHRKEGWPKGSKETKSSPAGSGILDVRERPGLESQIESRFGILPNFFQLFPETPDIKANLWGFAQAAYLDNPLPSLFKERLFVHLSRFCEVRYCIARHLGFLVGLGRPSGDAQSAVQTVEDVVRLLQRPFPRGEQLAPHFSLCQNYPAPLGEMPDADSDMEKALFAFSGHVFLQTPDAPACLDALKRLLGAIRLQYLILLLAFIRTAHYWTRVHPELSFEDDIKRLLATHEALATCILNDPEANSDLVSHAILDELPSLRRRADRAAGLLAAIVDSSDDVIVSKSLDGVITSWNKGAERLFGYAAKEAVGQHITLIIPANRRDEEVTILEQLKRGERVDHFETVRVRKDGRMLDISLTISPVKDAAGRTVGALKVARDITERKRSERVLAEQARLLDLSNDAILVRDVAGRRIARELHDSAGQTLTALSMSLARLAQEAQQNAPQLAEDTEEIQLLIQQLDQDIRTTSYLLHPPLLDESGLSVALGSYTRGLAERSGLDIKLSIPEDFERLPRDMELVVFRLVQECLTNVHRHSESKSAAVRIAHEGENISIEVQDQGKGISLERLAEIQSQGTGVGIRGMRERVRQFHGEMNIESNGSGTKISVTLPAPKTPPSKE